MKKIYLLIVFCCLNLAAFATRYFPSSCTAPYGGTAQTVCVGSNNTAASVNYLVCGTTSGTAFQTLTVTPNWYLNGVLIYTGATFIATTGGGIINLPGGAFTYSTAGVYSGVNGLKCVLTWPTTSPAACGSTVTITSVSTQITVVAAPSAITGTRTVCQSSTTTLADVATGGTWSSVTTSVATVTAAGGVVTGVGAGTSVISYTTGCGTPVSTIVTVNVPPSAITGASSVCQTSTITLADPVTGGTWSSTTPSVATITAGGVVTGVSGGTSTISYTTGCGTAVAKVVTVNVAPAAITGTLTVCQSSTTTLADAITGGTWSSVTPSVATISAGGVVTGVGGGTSTISYTTGCGTPVTTIVTVNIPPSGITGSTAICNGTNTTLSDPTPFGTWSSGTPGTATINAASGLVTTVAPGTTLITYSTGCSPAVTVVFIVNTSPAALTGSGSMCVGGTTTLNSTTTGGAWASGAPLTASVGTSGNVSGLLAGTATIAYTIGLCSATSVVTVDAPPASISGPTSVCTTGTITLADASGPGTWSSSLPATGSVSTGGVVSGLVAGTTTISYATSAVCASATYLITVNQTPGVITGGNSVCTGNILNLSDGPSGGTWSASSGIVAVNSSTGAVFGSSAGTVTITYNAAGCLATETVTVNAPPAAISGPTSVCTTGTITLLDATPGGTWVSSLPANGSIGSTGIVSGLTVGTTTISYTTFAVCAPATYVITVNPMPGPIGGGNTVCIGGILNLTDAVPGGTWAATSGIVTVNSSTGAILGSSAGTTTISYNAAGCFASEVVTVDAPAASITGPTSVCTTGSITLADGTAGGTWSSSQPTVGSIGTTGIVSGLTAGTTTISYTTYAVCAPSMYVVTVNPTPGAITGGNQVCIGLILNLSDPLSGGTWAASSAIVSVNTSTGLVLGVAAGSTTITYNAAGCLATETVTVNTPPSAITGSATSVCVGNTISLSNTVPGGTWTSSAVGTATVSPTGVVTGLAAGSVTISYSTTSCNPAIYMITVNAYPAAITGPSAVCESASSSGTAIGLSDVSPGGVWTSSAPGIATVGSGSGFVTGGVPGNVTITYTLLGCPVYHPITVNPAPAAITGPTGVCSGSSITLSDASAPGGTWTSSTLAVGSVGSSTGIVTGGAAGTTNISFTLTSTGCAHYSTITVTAIPAAISGSNGVCYGYTTSLTDATPGGTWTSSVPTNAYVGTATGIVTGLLLGTTTISYTLLTSGCYVTLPMTVNPNPAAPVGPPIGCIGSVMLFTDGTPAGTWSTSSTALATAGTAGDITGVSAGTVTVSYTLSTGCFSTASMLINTPPSHIAGDTTVCVTYHTQLMDSVSGGVWSSSALGSAFIDTTGNVLGIAPGTVNIFYAITGCPPAAFTITVNAIPAIITGTTYICDGVASQLYNDTLGGTWSSSDVSIVTLNGSTGFATGVSMGTAYVSYTLSTGCYAAIEVTVNPLAPPIAGTDSVCLSGSTWLTDIVGGGTWTSSNPAVATITLHTGLLTPLATGITYIVYTLNGGCSASLLETVFPPVQPMSAPNHICTGSSVLLTDAQTGGTWSSSNVFTASVNLTSGMLSAHYPDTVDITYTISAFRGCYFTKTITVNPLPSPVITHNYGTHSLSTFNYYTTYQWYSDRHGLIPGATAATMTLPYANDSFYVIVTDTNGCSNSAGWYYYLYTGVSNVTAADISIYPNPATSMVYIESPVTVRAVITSIDGRKVMEQANAGEIDLGKLSDGVYLIALYDNDGKILTIQKLVKQ